VSAAREARIEDYLHIGGDQLTARQAAERLGVTTRSIVRYRAELRRRRGEPARPHTHSLHAEWTARYHAIGADRLGRLKAARALGVCPWTIDRYRAALRGQQEEQAS